MNQFAAVGLLRNTSTGRFHPIVFIHDSFAALVEAVTGETPDKQPLMSFAHHHAGFETVEEVKSFIPTQRELVGLPTNFDAALDWDGEGEPFTLAWLDGEGKLTLDHIVDPSELETDDVYE